MGCCSTTYCPSFVLASRCNTARRLGRLERGQARSPWPAVCKSLLIEGVGATQASVRDELDVAIWVETDEPTRLARDAARVAAGEIDFEGYMSWMADENAYVITQQPWQHADLLVYGGDSVGHDRETEAVVAQVPAR
jgi:hypothetical protein